MIQIRTLPLARFAVVILLYSSLVPSSITLLRHSMDDPKRILIVRPSALGDVCRTVPVLVSLRRTFGGARIDWLVQAQFAEAIAAHPALDGIVTFPRTQMADWWHNPIVAFETLRWFASLRRRGYDLVLDFQALGRSGLITRATAARRRVGYRSAREFGWLGYTVRHPPPTALHTVDRMLDLLMAEGIDPVRDMRLYTAQHDQQWWTDRRRRLGIENGRYMVLAPTSRWPSKRWPGEYWSALIEPLLNRGVGHLVLVGSPAERRQVRWLALNPACAKGTVIDLVGSTSVGQTMAIVEGAGLVIANDSAPLHMAVGFSRPCIALFGPTDPARVGPYGRPESVLRPAGLAPQTAINFKDPNLGDALMRAIRPVDVLRRVDELPAERAGWTSPRMPQTTVSEAEAGRVKEAAL